MSTRTEEDRERHYEQAAARERLEGKRASKSTRYGAIDIIQDELSNVAETEWTVREFAERCIRRIHNLER